MSQLNRSQLKRRTKIVDAVIDLIAEAGAEAVQMRDVAQRSGVALATVYKYFTSKEDLLAVALDDWYQRVVRPIVGADDSAADSPDQDPLASIVDYLRRSQQAFYVEPEMTALTMQLAISTQPGAKVAIDQMLSTNAEIIDRLADVVAPEDLSHVGFVLNAVLTSSPVWVLSGRMTLEQAYGHIEWVARALLGDVPSREQK